MSRIALIGGSGSGLLASAVANVQVTPATRWGEPSGPVLAWEVEGHEIFFISRHGQDGAIPPHRVNYRANIEQLAELQVDCVLATNAVGAIAEGLRPGMLVLPDQLIDYTWGRAHTFFEGEDGKLQFADFTEPYDRELRKELAAAARSAGVKCKSDGIYGATQGPRLETAAEIDRMERDGCTVVGMTSMPEAALARERGLAYASICSVVNLAAGRSEGDIHAEIFANLEKGMARANDLIRAFLARI